MSTPRGKQDPRDAQRLFASSKFRWLEQVARDGKLPSFAARLCILLCPYFSLEHGGAAWPAQDTLAQVIGVRRERVNQVIKALVEAGHLTSTRRGRERPNAYRLVLKEATEQDLRCAKNRTSSDSHDVRFSGLRCAENRTRISPKTPGTPSASPGERERGCAPGRAGARPGAGVGRELVPLSGAGRFEELRRVWTRPWPEDDAADRRSFEEARRHASVEDILAGARAWFAAADDARYLPPLVKWLGGRCWEKPPPKRPKQKQRGNSKVDMAKLLLMREGLIDDEDGNLVEGRLQ